ncbi:hypothetical protein B0J11DRAFT_32668 [Dendryphion nanum]|uniref:Uncharacterized protein n=1 Tax=Dendryphion nanum TaxID=256645 RepID=A0A9P9EJV4_9PLEO|nr:hypothetical protein B0J11DRAFT_32668 [Dendryphion nanum]
MRRATCLDHPRPYQSVAPSGTACAPSNSAQCCSLLILFALVLSSPLFQNNTSLAHASGPCGVWVWWTCLSLSLSLSPFLSHPPYPYHNHNHYHYHNPLAIITPSHTHPPTLFFPRALPPVPPLRSFALSVSSDSFLSASHITSHSDAHAGPSTAKEGDAKLTPAQAGMDGTDGSPSPLEHASPRWRR